MGTEIENIDLVSINASPVIYQEPDKLAEIIKKIKLAVADAPKTAFLAKDRKTLASYANKIARSKVFLDKIGKDYVADLKKRPGQVDTMRRDMRNELDEFKEDVRKPLTEWEDNIKNRITAFDSADLLNLTMPELKEATETVKLLKGKAVETATKKKEAVNLSDLTIPELENRIQCLNNIKIDSSFDRFADQAIVAKANAVNTANAALLAAKLKAEAEKKAAELAKIERQKELEEAKESARKEAERKTNAETERRKFAEVQAKRAEQRAEESAKTVKLLKEKAVEIAAKKKEEEKRKEAEAKSARLADREHVAQVNREVLASLVKIGLDEKHAKSVVVAIACKRIPHVKIEY